jgi:diguanylate cyclase (GGDEF)-like protein/PAS domain S-box-containing protein
MPIRRVEAQTPLKSIARKKLEGKLVGGNFADLANYSDLFERTHDSILLLDLGRFEVLQCNPASERTLGVAAADLVGQELGSFFDEFTRARLEAFLTQTPSTAIDLRWASTKTQVTLELTVSRLELADYCTVLQLIARDVTAARAQQLTLESLSVTDELTGLSNRRAYNQRLEQIHDAAEKTGRAYAVLLLDVDNFKHFNDRNGHAAGDAALREIGKILKAHKSEKVFPARYGGEEFVLVVEAARPQVVLALAETLRAAVQASQVEHAAAQPLGFLSVSIGVACWSKGQTSGKTAKSADEALYECKEKGRNRVCVAQGK